MTIQISIYSEPLANAGNTVLESFEPQHRGEQELNRSIQKTDEMGIFIAIFGFRAKIVYKWVKTRLVLV